ncbi:hypothetical protein SAMN04487788_1691 [Microbacterium testaceum StLB037]|uniref:Uncharacterized protein n=1 Tax=Microbacterium testaceum (strain StLB037) TaxID=979556 RepID=A0A1H0P2A0_MICTS|nr:hypothetical protein [Microbacterium testaceum]SDO98836.1 hypothetical protein SAMN04487788_1691 [Microbacterium testaceum StLB037]
MTDMPALAGRILDSLRKLSHVLEDPTRADIDEKQSAMTVRRLVAEWALESRGFKLP